MREAMTSKERWLAATQMEPVGWFPYHWGIAVTSAGVMPPLCPPETIREVCRWVVHYPARM